MGWFSSSTKNENTAGDKQVTIIKNQILHSEVLDTQHMLLWAILIILLIATVKKILNIIKNQIRNYSMQTARSVANIQNV